MTAQIEIRDYTPTEKRNFISAAALQEIIGSAPGRQFEIVSYIHPTSFEKCVAVLFPMTPTKTGQ